jgi:hypothetical protein
MGPYPGIAAFNMKIVVHQYNSGEYLITGHKTFAGSILNFIYRAVFVFDKEFNILIQGQFLVYEH